jgi:redox-sensitive bicupin YhaK (pirin superfamily)
MTRRATGHPHTAVEAVTWLEEGQARPQTTPEED